MVAAVPEDSCGKGVAMDHARRAWLALAAFAFAVGAATPAFAQDYSDEAGAGIGIAMMCCWGLALLLGLALFGMWIWMTIDAAQRQEYEFPNSTGNSKTTWLLILGIGLLLGYWAIAAIVYYFMVFKKQKRGSGQPPAPGQYMPPPAPPAPPTYQPPTAPPTYEAPTAPPTYEAPSAPPSAPPAPPAPTDPPV